MSRYSDSFRGLSRLVPDRPIDDLDYYEPVQPWEPKLQVLSRSISRCVIRAGACRYVVIRIVEPDVSRVKFYKARHIGSNQTQVEDFCPVFEQLGDFDEALTAFAGRI